MILLIDMYKTLPILWTFKKQRSIIYSFQHGTVQYCSQWQSYSWPSKCLRSRTLMARRRGRHCLMARQSMIFWSNIYHSCLQPDASWGDDVDITCAWSCLKTYFFKLICLKYFNSSPCCITSRMFAHFLKYWWTVLCIKFFYYPQRSNAIIDGLMFEGSSFYWDSVKRAFSR